MVLVRMHKEGQLSRKTSERASAGEGSHVIKNGRKQSRAKTQGKAQREQGSMQQNSKSMCESSGVKSVVECGRS